MIKFWNYLRFSNIKLSIDLNPFACWFNPPFLFIRQRPTNIDPKLNLWHLRILFFTTHLVLDDGSYVLEENVDESEYFPNTKEIL